MRKNLYSMDNLSNTAFKRLRLLKQKKQRDEQHIFIAEGEKCITELLPAFRCQHIVATDEYAHLASSLSNQICFSLTTEQRLSELSLLQHPQGLIAYFQIPSTAPIAPDPAALLLALDDVQDPGNLGTIIRTADWFGIKHIVCSLSTVNCFNPKVVQATMGALSRVTLHYTDLTEFLQEARNRNISIYGTLLDGKNIHEQQPPKSGIIVMGNEGNGLSAQVRNMLTHSLFIPPYPPNQPTSESLNVSIATALILSWVRSPLQS